MYGTQATLYFYAKTAPFENDVNMYGTQANCIILSSERRFENDVNMYGTQAILRSYCHSSSLRMM